MNELLRRRNGKIYFGAWRINLYECGLWLGNYNHIKGTNIRPGKMTAELFREFLAYQRRVRRLGYANAPILRERITLSTRAVTQPNGWTAISDRLRYYADKLAHADREELAARMVCGDQFAIFHIDGDRVSLAPIVAARRIIDPSTGEEIVSAGQEIDGAVMERLTVCGLAGEMVPA